MYALECEERKANCEVVMVVKATVVVVISVVKAES